MIRNIKLQRNVSLFNKISIRPLGRSTRIATLIALVLLTTVTPLLYAQDATPTATQNAPLSARQIAGVLTGGQFAKIYLELRPDAVSASVTLTSDWNRAPANPSEVGFFVLNSDQFATVILGGANWRENNTASANPAGNSNQLSVSFNADSIFPYTLVVYNDSATDAEFTLSATNATIIDGSGQVRDPSKPNTAAPGATPNAVSTTEVATVAPTTIPTAAPTATSVAAQIPAQSSAGTSTSTTATTTTTTEAAPAVATGTPKVLRTDKLEGELPKQYDQHFFGLEPAERDGEIQLTFNIDPQDNSELARRSGFWVLDERGFKSYINGSRPSEVAIAAGSRLFDGSSNTRTASFRATGNEAMTVLVFNNSEIPATYQLTAKGASLVDDSAQSVTAQKLNPATTTENTTSAPSTVSNIATTTTTTDTATTTTAAPTVATTVAVPTPAQPTATPAAAATSATAPKIGSSYSIRRGDSISAIARDVYGDINLYDELCAYNKLANCAAIEIGDVIQLPQKDQLTSGAVAAATPTQPAATPTKAAASGSSSAVTTTQTVTKTQAVTATNPVTATKPVTATNATTSTTTTTTTNSTASKPAGNVVAAVQANGNFTIFAKLLKATGVDKTLSGAGPYTVFAPTDAAFNALPAGAVDQLLANPNGTAKQIALYHVVANSVTAADLEDGAEAVTLQGSNISFQQRGTGWKVQDSNMTTTDIQASNGVIHVVDKVMLPPRPQ